MNFNSKLKLDLDKQIKINIKKKFKIGSETMKIYISNIPNQKGNIIKDLTLSNPNFNNSLIGNNQLNLKSSFNSNFKDHSKNISEINNDNNENEGKDDIVIEKTEHDESESEKNKEEMIDEDEDESKDKVKINRAFKDTIFTIKGFGSIKDFKESDKNDIKKNIRYIDTVGDNENSKPIKFKKAVDSRNSSNIINKSHTDDNFDLDSLYFVDKVNIKSKAFKVPLLNFNTNPDKPQKQVNKNSYSQDLDVGAKIADITKLSLINKLKSNKDIQN